jgi:hypothetical protein
MPLAPRLLPLALLVAAFPAAAQAPATPAQPATRVVNIESQDAQHTREELHRILEKHPPALRRVLSLDPGLASNAAYLSAYPALAAYLTAHPEIARDPSYFFGSFESQFAHRPRSAVHEMWNDVMSGIAVFSGFGLAIGLLTWLVRTFIDYRRWNRLSKVQTEVHTKILDRLTSTQDLHAYIQSPAGARFLQSSPIELDAAPKRIGAPMSRILWTLQGGVVLVAMGIGFQVVSARATDPDTVSAMGALGILGMALGVGFLASAGAAFFLTQRLGLLEPRSTDARP